MEPTVNNSSKSKRPTKLELLETENETNDTEVNFAGKGSGREKRLKKDDSGINVAEESTSSEEGNCECANLSIGMKTAENCEPIDIQNAPSSPDSGNQELGSLSDLNGQEQKSESNKEAKLDEKVENSVSNDHKLSDSSDSDGDSEKKELTEEEKKELEEKRKKYDPTPNTEKPKHKWAAATATRLREYGYPTNHSPDHFRHKCYGSLHVVERLELMYKMKKHDGCVNALNFNAGGTKLVTGSDDLDVIIWDWTISEPLVGYQSGHRSNVFQTKFMPLSGDCHVVSCARDGQVRVADLSSDGTSRGTRKLAQHKGAAHKLALQLDSPHVFLSCGEDAVVFETDLRKEKPVKLSICKENNKKIPLYSIFINPQKSFEYIVSGRDPYVRVYDIRYLPDSEGPVKKYCPEHLVSVENRANVTSVVYNYNGQEILASYNDDDIYIFSANESDTTKYLHRYRGHRNNQTVKGVNYFGPKSEFIVSGSDCGFIFFWEKESEHIVRYMYGDEGGVVNCLESNPALPVLATSGLDDDIKIWVPSCEEPPNLSDLRNHIIENMREREEDTRDDCPDAFVDQTIWFLMQHLSRSRRRASQGTDARSSDADSDSSSSDSDMQDEEAEFHHAIQCNQS